MDRVTVGACSEDGAGAIPYCTPESPGGTAVTHHTTSCFQRPGTVMPQAPGEAAASYLRRVDLWAKETSPEGLAPSGAVKVTWGNHVT